MLFTFPSTLFHFEYASVFAFHIPNKKTVGVWEFSASEKVKEENVSRWLWLWFDEKAECMKAFEEQIWMEDFCFVNKCIRKMISKLSFGGHFERSSVIKDSNWWRFQLLFSSPYPWKHILRCATLQALFFFCWFDWQQSWEHISECHLHINWQLYELTQDDTEWETRIKAT